MYKILIKGKRNPFEVDNNIGKQLLDDWKNDTLPNRVEIQDAVFNSDEIKSIYKTNEQLSKKDNSSNIFQIEEEHRGFKNKMLNNPERYKNLTIMKFVWFAHTGTHDIPKEIEEKIITRQKKYLEENPDRVYANPICYKDIMRANMKKLKDKKVYQRPIMAFVERILC